MHLRHLMTLSYVRDHVGCPSRSSPRCCAWTPTTSCCCSTSSRISATPRAAATRTTAARHLVELTPAGIKALTSAERAQEAIEDDVLQALERRRARDAVASCSAARCATPSRSRAAATTPSYSATTRVDLTQAPAAAVASTDQRALRQRRHAAARARRSEAKNAA